MTWDNLTTIGFAKTKIGNAGAGFLALALENLDHISYVNLMNNGITAAGTSYLMDALRHKTKMRHFYFGGNKIGETGHKTLSVGVKNWPDLRLLNVNDTNLDDKGAIHLNAALGTRKLERFQYDEKGNNGLTSTGKALLLNHKK